MSQIPCECEWKRVVLKLHSLQKNNFCLTQQTKDEFTNKCPWTGSSVVSVFNFHGIDDLSCWNVQSCLYLRESTDASNNHTIYCSRQSIKRLTVYRRPIIICYINFLKTSNLVAWRKYLYSDFLITKGILTYLCQKIELLIKIFCLKKHTNQFHYLPEEKVQKIHAQIILILVLC